MCRNVRAVKQCNTKVGEEVDHVLCMWTMSSSCVPEGVVQIEVACDEREEREPLLLDQKCGRLVGVRMIIDVEEEAFFVGEAEGETQCMRVGKDVVSCSWIGAAPSRVNVTGYASLSNILDFQQDPILGLRLGAEVFVAVWVGG